MALLLAAAFCSLRASVSVPRPTAHLSTGSPHAAPKSCTYYDTTQWLTAGSPPTASDSGFGSSRCGGKRVQDGACVGQVGRVEAFGEPSVDRCKQGVRLVAPAVLAPEPREADGRAQLEQLGRLAAATSIACRKQTSAAAGSDCAISPFFRCSSASTQTSPVRADIASASSRTSSARSDRPMRAYTSASMALVSGP